MLLIADEVQTGFGRTGEWFAMNHSKVIPDILTGGKAIGGGTPVGFFSTTDNIASCYTRPGASTFGGNPVTSQAGLTFLRIMQRDNMVKRSADLGKLLKKYLENIAVNCDFVREIRGMGLMMGMEIKDTEKVSAAEITDEILEKMKERGFFIGKTGPGRNVLTLMPPIIIQESELLECTLVLGEILQNL